MTDTELLDAVRRIVREELDRAPEPSGLPDPQGEAVVDGLAPGERVGAAELHRRHREAGGTLTATALGRALARCLRVRRTVVSGRRFWERVG